MADRPTNSLTLQIDTVSAREGKDTLRQLRAGRGGRSSAFEPVLAEVQALAPGQTVKRSDMSRSDLNALRVYLYRYVSRDEFRIKSAQEGADRFSVVIGRWADVRG